MALEGVNKFCVAGWGKTGISLTKLLLFLGKKVKVTEEKLQSGFSSLAIKEFQKRGVEFEFGQHSQKFISDSEIILISPGISFFDSSLGQIARQLQIPCLGELEFASYFTSAKIIAITGTNGKTTTAHLTYLLLKNKGRKVYLGGNIGRPFSEIVLKAKKGDLIVLEVSSFQLETIMKFRPQIAALLSVYPDHIERHKSFENYFKAKMKIFQNQQRNDWAFVSKNNKLFKVFSSKIKAKVKYFGDEFSNENLSCVYRIGQLFGADKNDCILLFSQYNNLPHRRQHVATINKIKFINDSKATNPSSTAYALESIKGPVILIAGGRDKKLNYSLLRKYSRRIKKINLIGEASSEIKGDLGDKINCQEFNSLEEAVMASYKEALPGESVIFSPMCSSFDMFVDYQERGNTFVKIVKSIS